MKIGKEETAEVAEKDIRRVQVCNLNPRVYLDNSLCN